MATTSKSPSSTGAPENPTTGRVESREDVANLGLVRPPWVYLAAILVGVGLQLIYPLPWLPPGTGAWLGVPLLLAALALFFSATGQFRAAGTPVPGNQRTTTIVRSGPYRVSRNPIYLAFSLLVAAIGCWANSIWLLGTLVTATGVMHFVVIPREERYLERRFGAEYLTYKAQVRRWL